MPSVVKLEVSKQEITFKPSDARDFTRQDNLEPIDLTLTVVNSTERFASFQLELAAEGVDANQVAPWYSIEPNISAKKPPGDRTKFYLTILKSPIPAYDVSIPLQINILSPEIEQISTTQTVILKVSPPEKVLRAYLPIKQFTVYPGDRLNVPALVYNWGKLRKEIFLDLSISSSAVESNKWFPEGSEKSIYVEPNGHEEVLFSLVPPARKPIESGNYELSLKIRDSHSSDNDSDYGAIEILPFGSIEYTNLGEQRNLPDSSLKKKKYYQYLTIFQLLFENKSNLKQQITLDITSPRRSEKAHVQPLELDLKPGWEGEMSLAVQGKRPWLGRTRRETLTATPKHLHTISGEIIDRINVEPSSYELKIKIKPIIPFWLQIVSLLAAIASLLGLWIFHPKVRHNAPINSISLFADGTTVVSGGPDQKLVRWQVNQDDFIPDIRRLKFLEIIAQKNSDITTDKPIRVVQHLPGEAKNQVALGLEDGAIELWQTSPSRQLYRTPTITNRIFALAFTNDSQFLFSGHGSGEVYQWRLNPNDTERLRLVEKIYLNGDSVSAISVSKDSVQDRGQKKFVIIGAQSNRLALWDYQTQKGYNVRYEKNIDSSSAIKVIVGRNSFITSLSAINATDMEIAERPSIVVTADSDGTLTVWNLDRIQKCAGSLVAGTDLRRTGYSLGKTESILSTDNCGGEPLIIDQWQANAGGIPVRAIQLTNNGCYIASAGDDGRVMVWPLLGSGQRDLNAAPRGIELSTSQGKKLNSVDIHMAARNQKDILIVASDTPRNHIQVYRRSVNNNGCR